MTSSSPQRVLWVMKGLGLGGAERLLVSMAPMVDRVRYRLEVAYVLPWKDALVPELHAEGVSVHCLGAGTNGHLRWVGRLATLLRDERFALVHTHAPVPAVAARLVPCGAAYVHTEHNTWDRYRPATRVANAATYGRNAAVIAVSKGVAASISRPAWAPWRSLPAVHVIHHGVDLRRVRDGDAARTAARAQLRVADGELVVGTVANFTPKKDQRTLIAAFARLRREWRSARLVMVGTGPLEQQLKAQVDHAGLTAAVTFTGPRPDAQDLLPAFDVFALSSLHEGLSIALLEAMASGVPCVASRVGGIPEALRDGSEGFLVPPATPAALGDAVAKLFEDPALRQTMGARGRLRSAHFSIAAAVRETETLYDSVLAS